MAEGVPGAGPGINPLGGDKIDAKKCAKVEPPHPCDPPLPCDPNFIENECPIPHICLEKLKNPAWPGENTRCQPGSFMHVRACIRPDPPHPCDILPGCSLKTEHEKKRRLPCDGEPLCIERVKNPENRPKQDPSCNPNR